MKKLSKVLAMVLSGVAMVSAFALFANAEITKTRNYSGQFDDVSDTAWYASSVKNCYEYGLINGSSENAYNPQGFFTLAEAATVAARMHNLYNGGNGILPPASGAWYESAVEYCINNNIFSKGEYSDFTRYATREEMAAIMVAALPKSEWSKKNNVSIIPDVENNGGKVSDAIYTLYNAGILAGGDEYGRFQPKASVTRAEVAALVERMVDFDKRLDVKLTPISEKGAVVIPGEYVRTYEGGHVMFYSDGKYGVINVHGEIIIPAEYEYIDTLKDGKGFSIYKDGVCYAVDNAGKTIFSGRDMYINSVEILKNNHMLVDNTLYYGNTVAAEFHEVNMSGNFVYGPEAGNDSYIFYDLASRKISKFDSVYKAFVGENYVRVEYRNGGYAFYDFSGNKLSEYDNSYWVEDNGFVIISANGKYGLATPYGKIADELYDSVECRGEFAVLKYGSLYALASGSGIMCELGRYDSYDIHGDIVFAYCDGRVDIIDITGDIVNTKEIGYEYDNCFAAFRSADYNDVYVYCMETNEFYILGEYALEKDGKLYAADGVEIADVVYTKGLYFYKGLNGKYGLYSCYRYNGSSCIETRTRETEAIYDSPEDYIFQNVYYITNENGKPVVTYGNERDGFETVIQYYQKPFNYDKIEDVEYNAYYICTFNNVSYIVHP